jgi:hypothetical protein
MRTGGGCGCRREGAGRTRRQRRRQRLLTCGHWASLMLHPLQHSPASSNTVAPPSPFRNQQRHGPPPTSPVIALLTHPPLVQVLTPSSSFAYLASARTTGPPQLQLHNRKSYKKIASTRLSALPLVVSRTGQCFPHPCHRHTHHADVNADACDRCHRCRSLTGGCW